MKLVSVVIVTYNSLIEIKGCLESLYTHNDIGDKLEVIIVDNNSSDISALSDMLSVDFPLVRLIRNCKNGGYGQGNNLGIKTAAAPIILIMNPDVRLFFPIFKEAVKYYNNNPDLALLGMSQYEAPNRLGNSFLPLNESLYSLFMYKLCKMVNKYNSKFFFISGACFFIRKKHFASVGLFDENIFLYGEERDLNYRLRRINKSIVYNGSLGYVHPMHMREISLSVLKSGFDSFIYIYKKLNMNIKEELSNKIISAKLLKFRYKINGEENKVKLYSEYIDFLVKERNKFQNNE